MDVQTGDDDLLDEEEGDLDFLVDCVGALEGGEAGVLSVGEDRGRDMAQDCVGDDHAKDAAEDGGVVHQQVQARVEDEGLPGHHAVPAEDVHCGEADTDEAQEGLGQGGHGLRDDAPGGDEEGPEVQAGAALEGAEEDEVELDDVVERDGGEDDHGDGFDFGAVEEDHGVGWGCGLQAEAQGLGGNRVKRRQGDPGCVLARKQQRRRGKRVGS